MFLFDKLLHIQKEFYIKNPYFSIQFLFVWVVFKLLGFLKIILVIRLLICFLGYFVLFFFWENVIPRILNNIIFQYSLYFFYCIINFCLRSNWMGFCLSSIPFVFFIKEYSIEPNLIILLPNLDYFFIVILFFNFFKRFNQNIIIIEISKGFIFKPVGDCYFHWFDILNLISSHFLDRFKIANTIHLSQTNGYFKDFPFSYSSMQSLDALGLNNSSTILMNSLKIYKENLTSNQKNFIIQESVKNLQKDLQEKQIVTQQAAKIAQEINQKFYWEFLQGLFLGFILFLVLLNFFYN